ncbi:MAG: molybdopterin converting factor subunit 1 [Methylobacterium mesophilicum]|nr:molybdopterin converting factor subunit 1 [Methylobacterium mesophilicum]
MTISAPASSTLSTNRAVTLRYFAWVRERIGVAEERLELGEGVETVRELLCWLSSRGETYAAALKQPEVIRVSLDHRHADHAQPIGRASEIALFPPMTGG